MAYTTQRSTCLAGLVLAVLMATVINGSMLWKMDDIAHNGSQGMSTQVPSYITLETVTIVGTPVLIQGFFMKALLLFVGWFILLCLSWPLALLALLLWPLVFILSIPFAILGIGIGAALALLKAVLFLPARVLGYRP